MCIDEIKINVESDERGNVSGQTNSKLNEARSPGGYKFLTIGRENPTADLPGDFPRCDTRSIGERGATSAGTCNLSLNGTFLARRSNHTLHADVSFTPDLSLKRSSLSSTGGRDETRRPFVSAVHSPEPRSRPPPFALPFPRVWTKRRERKKRRKAK